MGQSPSPLTHILGAGATRSRCHYHAIRCPPGTQEPVKAHSSEELLQVFKGKQRVFTAKDNAC
jgi:hypothetical protein